MEAMWPQDSEEPLVEAGTALGVPATRDFSDLKVGVKAPSCLASGG